MLPDYLRDWLPKYHLACFISDVEDFPSEDVTSLATLIPEIEDTNRFPTLKHFLSHFGWCPQSFQSGNYRLEHPKMSPLLAIGM
ncbi:MAG: transposase [Dehalococcoidia bacterium]|nr:transposase [Dehalococcoidia bacterium]